MTRRRGAEGLALLVALLVVLAIVLHPFGPVPAARTITLDAWPRGLAVDTRTGRVMVVAADAPRHIGRIVLLDTTTGQSVWAITVGDETGAAAIDARSGHGFVTVDSGTGGGRVDLLDLHGGRLLASAILHRDTSGAADALPLAMQSDQRSGRVFVSGYRPGNGQGFVSTLDAANGHVLRTENVGPRPDLLAVSEGAGRVYVGCTAGVSVLDARSGAVVRSVPLPAPAAIAADDRAGRVFIATGGPSDGAGGPSSGGPSSGGPGVSAGIAVLDAASGAMLRTIPLSAPAGALAVDEASGRLIVGQPGGLDSQGTSTGAGRVTVLDAGRGTVLASMTLSQSPVLLADDARSGRVYVATRDTTTETPAATGRVFTLEARTGRLLSTLLTNVAPIALAFDGQHGHAIVLDYGGTVSYPDNWGWLPGWMRSRLPFLTTPGPRTRAVPGSVSILDATG